MVGVKNKNRYARRVGKQKELTIVDISLQPTGFWCRHWTTTEGVEEVLEGNLQAVPNKPFLLVGNLRMNLS